MRRGWPPREAPPAGPAAGRRPSRRSRSGSAACSSTRSARSRAARCSCSSRASARCATTALEPAAYRDRALFDAWAHEASLVATRRPAAAPLGDAHLAARRVAARRARARVPRRQRRASPTTSSPSCASAGPLRARDLEDRSAEPWRHGWWTDEVSARQTIGRMLHLLWMSGRVGVVRPDRRHGAPVGRLRALPARGRRRRGRRPRRRRRRARGGAARGADARRRARRRTCARTSCAVATRGCPRRSTALVGRRRRLERVAVGGLRGEWFAAAEDLERLRRPARRARARPRCRPSTTCSATGRDRRAVRLRPSPGDLRPGGAAALGLLRAADPAPRADRRARRPVAGPRRPACCACSRCTASPTCGAARRSTAPSRARSSGWRRGAGRAGSSTRRRLSVGGAANASRLAPVVRGGSLLLAQSGRVSTSSRTRRPPRR